MEAKGPGAALVGDATLRVDQVEAIGPGGESLLSSVAEFVEHRWNADTQLAHTGSGHEGAFFFALRAGEDDAVFDVALHLPDIAGMRFGDVDNKKARAVFVLVEELIESGSLPPEGRSGVAAEDEHHGLLVIELREADAGGFVELEQIEVRRGVAEAEVAGASAQP
jgi:hypothetical protein